VKPLIAIVGETASGKSGLAMEIAMHFNGEIIAADAMTVYKDFDIGTAKPSVADQAKVRHHLLDIADAARGFTVSDFQGMTYRAIEDILSRGKVPILVGGSGLYIDSVLYDFSFSVQPSATFRAELNALSLEELHAIAREGGFDLSSIDAQNKRRVIRLIESKGTVATRGSLRDQTLVLGVSKERHELLGRVEQRVKSMIDAGLEQEVRGLAESFGWTDEPMRSVGYREWHAYFNAECTLEEVGQQIVMDTMKLAKKQRTWFRRNKSIHWIDSDEYVDIVTTFLNKYPL
jgi:tRNA dimethylallyltransferase